VTPRKPPRTPLFATRWVHVFEEDSPAGASYRPDTEDLPLSRRPRDGFELSEDGTARVFAAGPGDRPEPRAATWSREGEQIVITVRGAREGPALRVVEQAAGRLRVHR